MRKYITVTNVLRCMSIPAALVLVQCTTRSPVDSEETSRQQFRPQPGTMRVLVQDAPFPYDQVSRVDLYIESIAASVKSDTGASADDSLQTGLQTIVVPRKTFNLLSLVNGTVADLGCGAAISGEYVQVRVTINTDSSSITLRNGSVLTGGNNGIQWYGGALQSINMFTDPPIAVPDSGAVVLIDFNLGKTFRPRDQSGAAAGFDVFWFVSVLNTAATGSLRGSVAGSNGEPIRDASVSLLKNPFPADTPSQDLTGTDSWSVFGTTRTDSTGHFEMTYLRADSGYVLLVETPANSAYRFSGMTVDVTKGQETDVGTITLQQRGVSTDSSVVYSQPIVSGEPVYSGGEYADNFMVTTNVSVTSVRYWNSSAVDRNCVVRFYTDDSGKPQPASFADFAVPSATTSATSFLTLPGFPVYEHVVPLSTPLSLRKDTVYYVSIVQNGSALWSGAGPGSFWYGPAGSWSNSSSTNAHDLAFELIGRRN